MFDTNQVYAYGYIAGLIEREAVSHGQTIVTAKLFEDASMRPSVGFAQINNAARRSKLLTDDLAARIADIAATIDAPIDDDAGMMPKPLPLPLQGTWQLGYYHALGGKEPAYDRKTGIREMRKAAGMTQAQLADKMGCSQEHISRWETGAVIPGADTIKQIADALGCSMDALV